MKVTCSPSPCQKFEQQNVAWEWVFKVSTKVDLKAIIFRDPQQDGASFNILFVSCKRFIDAPESKKQFGPELAEWVNPDLKEGQLREALHYIIRVAFVSWAYGKFTQGVEFTFANGARKLCQLVAVISRMNPMVEATLATSFLKKQWLPKSLYEKISSPTLTEQDRALLDQYDLHEYAAPTIALTFGDAFADLQDQQQIRILLHSFLFLEEVAQIRLTSRYSGLCVVSMTKSIHGGELGLRVSQNDELYAEIELARDLDDDSPEAQVMISHASIVYLELLAGSEVFGQCEGVIEEKRKSSVIVRLSAAGVRMNQLFDGARLRVFARFLPSRMPFCEKHWAVDEARFFPLDALSITKILNSSPAVIPSAPKMIGAKCVDQIDLSLDRNQSKALAAALLPRDVISPPIVIRGPYGTGKTHTVGATVMEILIRQPESRILICTQSNSAADLYVTRYFNRLLPEFRFRFLPFRIYYTGRKLASIDPKIWQFCNIKGGDPAYLYQPTLKEVLERRVVITTCVTSRLLAEIGVKRGSFTHIFLDEAGQALVCEALIPFALCDQYTKVILAGDPKQMCSKVYCDFAQHFKFDISLMEYIGQHYQEEHPFLIRLARQHRSESELSCIMSRTFYPDEYMETLDGSVENGDGESYQAEVRFYHQPSEHQFDEDGFPFNAEQVECLVAVVKDLRKLTKSVAVITPSRAQIIRVRSAFRRDGLGEVIVDSVANIQGREYEHIVLSFPRSFRGKTLQWIDDVDATPESDVQMTLTACTRAIKSVTIVGNSIYLCLTLHTGKLWKNLLEFCGGRNSLIGIDYATLLKEIDTYERIKKYRMNLKAPEFVPLSHRVIQNPIDDPAIIGQYPMSHQGLVNRMNQLSIAGNGVEADPIDQLNLHLDEALGRTSDVQRRLGGARDDTDTDSENEESIVKDEAQRSVFGKPRGRRQSGHTLNGSGSHGSSDDVARTDSRSSAGCSAEAAASPAPSIPAAVGSTPAATPPATTAASAAAAAATGYTCCYSPQCFPLAVPISYFPMPTPQQIQQQIALQQQIRARQQQALQRGPNPIPSPGAPAAANSGTPPLYPPGTFPFVPRFAPTATAFPPVAPLFTAAGIHPVPLNPFLAMQAFRQGTLPFVVPQVGAPGFGLQPAAFANPGAVSASPPVAPGMSSPGNNTTTGVVNNGGSGPVGQFQGGARARIPGAAAAAAAAAQDVRPEPRAAADIAGKTG